MTFRFPCIVTDIFERKVSKHVSGVGKDAVFTSDSAGWYVRINDAITLWVGAEKPEWKAGEKLVMILKRSQ